MAADKTGSLQMKADKTALQRALRRLEGDEATLKSDTASGRMSAESKDAMQGYTHAQAVKSEGTNIAADKGKGCEVITKSNSIYLPGAKACTASVGGPYAACRISLIFGQGSGSKFAYRSMSPWVIHRSTAVANDGRCLMRSYHAATPGRLSHIRASLSWERRHT
jgi:hypothetical protein